MSPDEFPVVALPRFALAGALASRYGRCCNGRQVSTCCSRASPKTFAAVPFRFSPPPSSSCANTLRGLRIERRRFEFVMMATVLAGFWSLMSGTFVVMSLKAMAFWPERAPPRIEYEFKGTSQQQLRFKTLAWRSELDGQAPGLPADSNISSPIPPW